MKDLSVFDGMTIFYDMLNRKLSITLVEWSSNMEDLLGKSDLLLLACTPNNHRNKKKETPTATEQVVCCLSREQNAKRNDREPMMISTETQRAAKQVDTHGELAHLTRCFEPMIQTWNMLPAKGKGAAALSSSS